MPSWAYQDSPLPGYWGDINSHFNFCEEDYMVTSYVAELVNTITSFIYVLWGAHGIYTNHGRQDAWSRNLPNVGAICVGVGSILFHLTMKNYTQWCDDLSMLLATGIILHRIYTFDQPKEISMVVGSVITFVLTTFSIWHCYVDETNMHSLLFGVMMVVIAAKSRSVIHSRVSNPAVKQDVAKLNIWGAVIFLIGYGIWNLDYLWCNKLIGARRAIGMPWSFLLEFHGWWHIFTAIGGYVLFAVSEHVCSDEANEPLQGRYFWPVDSIIGSAEGSESKLDLKAE